MNPLTAMNILRFTSMAFAIAAFTPALALAAPSNALCSIMDSNVLSSWQLSSAPAVAAVPVKAPSSPTPTEVSTCTWSSKDGTALTLSSSPFKGRLPTSCNVQQIAGGSSMTMCMASGAGAMLSVVLVQPAGKVDQDAAAKLRRHTEALAAKLGKAVKPS